MIKILNQQTNCLNDISFNVRVYEIADLSDYNEVSAYKINKRLIAHEKINFQSKIFV